MVAVEHLKWRYFSSLLPGSCCGGMRASGAHDSPREAVAPHDYTSGESYQAVLQDYAEAVVWFGVSVLPTVIFNEKVSLVGAVPVAQYRLLLDCIRAGEPGGLIPLACSVPATGAAGRSAGG